MAIFKTRQPLSTLDIITISFNVLETSGIFVKKKKNPNITSMKQEQSTLSISGGGSVGGEIMYLR